MNTVSSWVSIIDTLTVPNPRVRLRLGPPAVMHLEEAPSLHAFFSSHCVPWFRDKWLSLQGSSLGIPGLRPAAFKNPIVNLGNALERDQAARIEMTVAHMEKQKVAFWNLLVLHIVDGELEVFCGFVQPEGDAVIKRSILDIFESVYLLMDRAFRLQDFNLININTEERLDWAVNGSEPAPPGLYRLETGEGPCRQVPYSIHNFPLTPDESPASARKGYTDSQLDMPVHVAGDTGHNLSLGTQLSRASLPEAESFKLTPGQQGTPTVLVRQPDSGCVVTGIPSLALDSHPLAKTDIAHIIPMLEEQEIWRIRDVFDPASLDWDVVRPAILKGESDFPLSPSQMPFYESNLRLLPHHPANLITLLQHHHIAFNQFSLLISPFSNKVVSQELVHPRSAALAYGLIGHNQIMRAPGSPLLSPNPVALACHAIKVLNRCNRLWGRKQRLRDYPDRWDEWGVGGLMEQSTRATEASTGEMGGGQSKTGSTAQILGPQRSLPDEKADQRSEEAKDPTPDVSAADTARYEKMQRRAQDKFECSNVCEPPEWSEEWTDWWRKRLAWEGRLNLGDFDDDE